MQWFRQALVAVLNKEADFDSDSLKLTHHTSTMALNADTMKYVSDLTNELATGGGYTSGGLTATGDTVTYTAANSYGTSRANSTVYAVGNIIRPATGNGFLYRCSVAGTSAASIPTYGVVLGGTTTDGGVTWTMVGSGIIVFTMTNASWATATFTGVRYTVLSDRTPATAATQPLLGYIDWVTDQAGGGGSFTINWDSQGVLQLLVP